MKFGTIKIRNIIFYLFIFYLFFSVLRYEAKRRQKQNKKKWEDSTPNELNLTIRLS